MAAGDEASMRKAAWLVGLVGWMASTSVLAGPIEDRQLLMKQFATALQSLQQMSAAKAPLDIPMMDTQLQVLVEGAGKLPSLFPAGSDTGTAKSAARDSVWRDPNGFSAAAALLVEHAQSAQAATDKNSLAQGLNAAEKDCASCHAGYRN